MPRSGTRTRTSGLTLARCVSFRDQRHLATVDVAAAGGWGSEKTLAIYQQSDPQSVLAAVMAAG